MTIKNLSNVAIGSKVRLTAITGMVVQVGRPLVSLLTLPLLLQSLGEEGLGVWMIALSMMTLVGFVSTGLSASIVTLVGRSSAEGSSEQLSQLTTSATLIAFIWGGIIILLAVPLSLVLNWTDILSLTEASSGVEVGKLMAALAGLLGFGFVASVPRQVMVGRLHGYLAYLLDSIGIIVGALLLIGCIWIRSPLWAMGIAFLAPTYFSFLIGGSLYLRRNGISLFDWKYLHTHIFRSMLRDSFKMAGYQGAYAISIHSDLLLIGVFLGAPATAMYGIAHRIFSLPILVALMVNHAQWPAMARADASGDTASVAKTLKMTIIFGSSISLLLAVLAALAIEPLQQLWLGTYLEIDNSIILGMVFWVLIATLVNTCDSVLRARNETTFLMRSMICMAIINLTTTITLLPLVGSAGAIFGSIVGFLLALLIPYSLRLRAVFQV